MITIDDIIKCEKTINRKIRPIYKESNRHSRMDIKLDCVPDTLKMTMFLRRLIALPEDFTIGLRLDGANQFLESDIVLVRFQGPHGGQSIDKSLSNFHNAYHKHCYTQDDLDHRRKLASNASEKANFNSIEEAIIDFLEYCHISDPNGIFNEERNKLRQMQFDLSELDK